MKASPYAAALALTVLAGSAIAADLPAAKAPPPPPLPVFSWGGFYVGANVGYTWGAKNSISSFAVPIFDNDPLFGAASAVGATSVIAPEFNGAIGGGQVGWNYQFRDVFVAGLEADIQGASVQGTASTVNVTPVANQPRYSITTITQASRNLDYLGTIRGRIGYLFHPRVLIYATGGLAYGGVSQTVGVSQLGNFSGAFFLPPATDAFGFSWSKFSDTRVGYAAGAGLEWAFLDNWSAKLDYLYYDLGRVRSEGFIAFDTNALSGFGGGGTGVVSVESQTRFNGHLVRAGLNYRLNFYKPPVVAKY